MDRFAELRAQARRNLEAARLQAELDAQEAGAIAALGGPAQAVATLDALLEEAKQSKAYTLEEFMALLDAGPPARD